MFALVVAGGLGYQPRGSGGGWTSSPFPLLAARRRAAAVASGESRIASVIFAVAAMMAQDDRESGGREDKHQGHPTRRLATAAEASTRGQARKQPHRGEQEHEQAVEPGFESIASRHRLPLLWLLVIEVGYSATGSGDRFEWGCAASAGACGGGDHSRARGSLWQVSPVLDLARRFIARSAR